jgi:hypothetical protein
MNRNNNTNNNANKRGCTGRFCKKLGNKARNLTKKVTNWFQTPAETQNGAAGVQKTPYRGRAGSNEYAREMERLHQAERQKYNQYVAQENAKRILTGQGVILPTWDQIQRREYRDPRLPPLTEPVYEAPVLFTPPVPRVEQPQSTSRVYYNAENRINRLGENYIRYESNNNMRMRRLPVYRDSHAPNTTENSILRYRRKQQTPYGRNAGFGKYGGFGGYRGKSRTYKKNKKN